MLLHDRFGFATLSAGAATRMLILGTAIAAGGCGDDITGPLSVNESLPPCFDYFPGQAPPIVASVATNYPAYQDFVSGSAMYGDILYVSSNATLTAVDVSNPDSPRILASNHLPRQSRATTRCTVSAGGPPRATHETVCVLDWYSGFWFFAASSGGACTNLSFTHTSIPSYDIVQIGNRVFVATQSNGVEVYDISATAAPCATTTLESGKAVFDLFAADTRLYLAMGYDGILVYQVLRESIFLLEQTDHPTFLIVTDDEDVYGVCPQLPHGGPLLLTRFVSESDSTSQLLAPVSATELSAFPRSLVARDGVVYVAAGSTGLEVFLDDPEAGIRRLGSFEITMPVTNVSTVSDFLYLGSWQGLHVLPLQCADAR